MLLQTLAALAPVVFVLALGYGAGKAHAFDSRGTAAVTELVLDFALPASLFTATVAITRDQLIRQAPLLAAFAIALSVAWTTVFLFARVVLHRDTATAALQALVVSFCAVPFFGLAVLGGVLHSGAGIATGIGAIVVNVLLVPATTIALTVTGGDAGSGGAAAAIRRAALTVVKTPYIVAPVLGMLIVLAGLRIPGPVQAPLQLIGNASSGVGLFTAGLVLASLTLRPSREVVVNALLKLVEVPGLFIATALLLHASHAVLLEGTLMAAFPTGPIAVLLAVRHRHYQQQASTTLALTTLGFIVTLPVLQLLLSSGS